MADHHASDPLQRALVAFRSGRLDEADRLCRSVLSHDDGNFEASYLAGMIAGKRGRAVDAAGFFAKAARLRPDLADVHFNLGIALGEQANHAEAIKSYARAVELDPRHADAHFNRGVALGNLGRHQEALGSYDRVVGLRPSSAEAHHNRGITLALLGRPDEAIAAYDRAIALRPAYPLAYKNRGSILASLGRWAEALESFERAAAIDPGFAEAHDHCAMALLELDRPTEALARAERALALQPALADAWYNRGNALRELRRYQEAVSSYERAIELQPGHGSAVWNLSDVLLLLGDFERGWEIYSRRFSMPPQGRLVRPFESPLWIGQRPVDGKTVLLHSELGLGDTLQYCRYVSEVAKLGAKVVVEVQPPLAGLLHAIEGAERVIPQGEALPHFDCHCPFMALPCVFKASPGNVPAEPYVRADPAKVSEWRRRLGHSSTTRIGLVWHGSRRLTNDTRSMALQDFVPLFSGNAVEWVSLQKEIDAAERELLRQHGVREIGGELVDFEDTAAVLEVLDLLVTVDTSVAHLAGAMGRPLWMLLGSKQHDWRWMLERSGTMWYPSARLFRQTTSGTWNAVMAEINGEIGRVFR